MINHLEKTKTKQTLIVKLKETCTCSKYIVLSAKYLSKIFIQILLVNITAKLS